MMLTKLLDDAFATTTTATALSPSATLCAKIAKFIHLRASQQHVSATATLRAVAKRKTEYVALCV